MITKRKAQKKDLKMEKGIFKKIGEICIDSDDNVIVNWDSKITEDRITKLLKKALESIVKYKVLW